MALLTEQWVGQVMTVLGPIPAGEMGVTLPHEHLLARHQGPLVDTVDATTAREEIERFVRHGGRTVVDMTNVDLQRDPLALRRIAAEAQVNVVMGTGFYKDAWLPREVHDLTVEQMTATMVGEIVAGADGTGIRAGVIGELGVSRPITATEERVLAAAARAQRQTGAAINVHFDIGGDADEYNHAVDILEHAGADLQRVVLDHFICRPDEVPLCRQLASRGCTIEFDLWGQESWPKIYDLTRNTLPEVQIASLRWFVEAGLLEHILISQDIANIVCWRANGGYGYAHILQNLVPQFRAYGMTDDQLHTLMVENPARLFPFQPVAGRQ
jgi:phosphotriesterase-related protein